MQQRTLEKKLQKYTSLMVKVIEVRTSYKLHDEAVSTMPLMVWVVVVYNIHDQPVEVHTYDKPIKAQRKFERLTK
jgi:hypothetical protein